MSFVDRLSFTIKQDGNKLNIYVIKHNYKLSDNSEKKDEPEPFMQFIFDTPFNFIHSQDEFTHRVHHIEIIKNNSEESKS